MFKRKAGIAGVIIVAVLLLVKTLEIAGIALPLLDTIRKSPAELGVLNFFLSPVLLVILILAAIYLIADSRNESEPQTAPPPPHPPEPHIKNAFKQETHVHVSTAPEQPKPSPPPPSHPKEKYVELTFLHGKQLELHRDDFGVWYDATKDLDRAHPGLVALFKNVHRDQGQRTPTAIDVSASLVFKNRDGSSEHHVNHGSWTWQYEYVTTFHPDETRALIIAIKFGNPFVALDNPNKVNPHGYGTHRSPIVKASHIALWDEGTVQITLVDYHGITIFDGLFGYAVSLDAITLTKINTPPGLR